MMDRDDYELFERSVAHAVGTHDGAGLDAALGELGWVEAAADDPRSAITAVFGQLGRANARSTALGTVVADALGLDPATAVALPAVGHWAAPGRVDGAVLHVDALVLDAPGHRLLVVDTDGAHGHVVDGGGLVARAIEGMDPTLGLTAVTGRVAIAEAVPVDWPVAVQRAQLALAHQLIGAARAMLELARTHALERIQFGVPIASFQAVRHKLAETLVSIEMAEAIVDAAWEHGDATTTAIAKATAGRAARTAAKHCQQVLAGIGFTTEHPFHRYVRRVLVLDELFGSTRALTKALGEQIIATRQLPAVLPL